MVFFTESMVKCLQGLLNADSQSQSKHQSDSFSCVTNDSRKVSSACVFVAIAGSLVDGHDYIADAIRKGAKVIVHQQSVEKENGVTFIHVSDSYSAYARIAELSCGFPAEKLNLIGITGTNGKTTTAYLIRSIIQESGSNSGLISTVEYAYPGKIILAERTTPDALEIQALLCDIRNSGCEYAIMETSSHALYQNRTGSAKFAIAVFTNLSGDHLDYHNDMKSYYNAKKLLFKNHLKNDGYAVINIDDAYGKKIINDLGGNQKIITFGRGGDLEMLDVETSFSGTKVLLKIDKNEFTVDSPLCGEFNAYNIAGAVAAAYALGFSLNTISNGIKKMRSVPGRMEGFSLPGGALAVVDYAHTDDALKNVLTTLRKLDSAGRLTVVFGCGGDRDHTKRARMGAVAARFADKVVLTSDNPRTEPPLSIIENIIAGIPENIEYDVIPNRETAIKQTLELAKDQDIILIAGKGHEAYQEINGVKHPFDDREIVKLFL